VRWQHCSSLTNSTQPEQNQLKSFVGADDGMTAAERLVRQSTSLNPTFTFTVNVGSLPPALRQLAASARHRKRRRGFSPELSTPRPPKRPRQQGCEQRRRISRQVGHQIAAARSPGWELCPICLWVEKKPTLGLLPCCHAQHKPRCAEWMKPGEGTACTECGTVLC
jgi:hypothetical protein